MCSASRGQQGAIEAGACGEVMGVPSISHSSGYCGARDTSDYFRIRRKNDLRDRRDERMNQKLGRHRMQVLKRRAWIFAYLMAAPLAIGCLSMAWKFAIYATFG
jgi:hypothetical protein